MLSTHRHDGRFWETRELVELLVVRFGAAHASYERTREYRALVSTIRARNSANPYRKGYGLDWKGLKRDEKTGELVKDKNSFPIKDDVLDYLANGRIPMSVLPYACEQLREAEVRVCADALVRARVTARIPLLAEAAE